MKLKKRFECIKKVSDEIGHEAVINNYDKYRKYSPIFWSAVGIYAFIKSNYSIALICLAVIHLQIIFNQLWWKLVNIEHYYIKGGKDDSKSKVH